MKRIRKNAYTDFSTNPERDKFVWTYQLSNKSTEKQILSTISYIKYASRISKINKKFLTNKKFLLKALKMLKYHVYNDIYRHIAIMQHS